MGLPTLLTEARGNGHLFLTGMPGVGKSTVAPLLAESLGLPWCDLDVRYRQRFGESPAGAIRRQGERNFRGQEMELLREVAAGPRTVVACGGGTLARSQALALAQAHGLVVTLTAPLEVLAERLAASGDHPLLEGPPRATALAHLQTRRQALYDRSDLIEKNWDRSPPATAMAIRGRALAAGLRPAGKMLPLVSSGNGATGALHRADGDCSIRLSLEEGLGGLGRFAAECAGRRRSFVAGDARMVGRLAGDLSMEVAPCGPPLVLGEGEESKDIGRFAGQVAGLLERGVTGSDLLVAVGGGAALDAAGFLASVYWRGMPALYVGTTLLAAVDAAVGGKTALNCSGMKNAVGTIRQPQAAFLPLQVIAAEVAESGGWNGAGELFKSLVLTGATAHDVAAAGQTLAALRRGGGAGRELLVLVARALGHKLWVVWQDEGEKTGLRRTLNLGHTFAHLVESATGHALGHGRAVAWGVVVAARISEALGVAPVGTADELISWSREMELWPPPPLARAALRQARLSDKKEMGEEIELVLLEGPGRPRLQRVAKRQVEELFARLM